MKRITLLLFMTSFLLATQLFAQAPQGVSYQAVAFDASGVAVTNSTVGVRVSVLDNSATGTLVYEETHNLTTNAQGLFNFNIGQGTPSSAAFSTINWAVNSKFLKVEVDPTGGTNYLTVGTNELMSVPYALFAEETGNVPVSGNISEQIITSKTANFAFNDSQDDLIYVFNSLTGNWHSQNYNPLGGNPTINESNGSFIFNDSQDDLIYVFNAKTDSWTSQSYNPSGGNPTIITDTLLSNFIFNDSQDDKIYVFNSLSGNWSSQSYNSLGGNPTIIESKGNFAFNDSQDDVVYVFNAQSDLWSSQSYNSSGGNPNITTNYGNFIFNDSQDDMIYINNTNTGVWSSQSYNGLGGNPTILISEIE